MLKAKGVALVAVLITVAVIAGLTALMFTRTLAEMGHSRDSAEVVQTLTLARGGINVANGVLWGPLQNTLSSAVNDDADPSAPWSFGDAISGNTTNPDAASVQRALETDNGSNSVVPRVQTAANQLLCNGSNLNVAPSGTSATVNLRIYFSAATPTACGYALPSGITLPKSRFISGAVRGSSGASTNQVYSLPFVAISDATQGVYRRNVVVQGELRFVVAGSSFARYAYFTNVRNTGLYFQDADLVDGPVHSNQYLRFSGNPWFGDAVTVAGCQTPTLTTCGSQYQGDEFGSGNFKTVAQIGTNGGPCFSGYACPTFANGSTFTASYVPLPNNITNQQTLAQQSGLSFTTDLYSLTLFAGGNTDSPVTANGASSTGWNASSYQYLRACLTAVAATCTTYRFGSNQILQQGSGSTWTNVVRSGSNVTFNGVIFSTGIIQNFGGPARSNSSDPATAPPAVASFAQMSVFTNDTDPGGTSNDSVGSIVVTQDLKYEVPPCTGSPNRASVGATVSRAVCSNLSAQNVLGVYSQNGSVTFGATPSRLNNLTAQGVFMSGSKRVGVTDYCNGNQGGQLRILGGVIGNVVSGFGCGSSGYNRSITYDQRMSTGFSPPYFPTTTQARVANVFTINYGQREQVNLN